MSAFTIAAGTLLLLVLVVAALAGARRGAIRRCVMCPSVEECDHWVASGKTDGIRAFCPNASVLEEMHKR
jgi:hypothetical protein